MSRTLWGVIGSSVMLLSAGCGNQITPAGANNAASSELAQTVADLVSSILAFGF